MRAQYDKGILTRIKSGPSVRLSINPSAQNEAKTARRVLSRVLKTYGTEGPPKVPRISHSPAIPAKQGTHHGEDAASFLPAEDKLPQDRATPVHQSPPGRQGNGGPKRPNLTPIKIRGKRKPRMPWHRCSIIPTQRS